jgi:hypothetical protein
MLEAVSVSAPLVGYASMGMLAHPGSAMSREASALQRQAAAVMRSASQSQALYGTKSAAVSALWMLVAEFSTHSPDGAGSLPPALGALVVAEQVIRALPGDLPVPELAVEPDGAISLDWIVSRNCMLSISAGPTDRLSYAWVDGADHGHAVAHFDGERIPARIVAGIRALMNRDDTTIRSL